MQLPHLIDLRSFFMYGATKSFFFVTYFFNEIKLFCHLTSQKYNKRFKKWNKKASKEGIRRHSPTPAAAATTATTRAATALIVPGYTNTLTTNILNSVSF